jgi:hypothetical protein
LDHKQDDPSITDDDGLLRRVPHFPNMTKYNHNTSSYELTSACFSDRDDGYELSISLETPLLESGKCHQDILEKPGFNNYGLARVESGFVRREIEPAQSIVRNPVELDPYHGLVVGKKSKSAKRKLARHATIIISPTPST